MTGELAAAARSASVGGVAEGDRLGEGEIAADSVTGCLEIEGAGGTGAREAGAKLRAEGPIGAFAGEFELDAVKFSRHREAPDFVFVDANAGGEFAVHGEDVEDRFLGVESAGGSTGVNVGKVCGGPVDDQLSSRGEDGRTEDGKKSEAGHITEERS